MNRQVPMLYRSTSILFALCLGLASASALAAGSAAQASDSPQAKYQEDMALCKSSQSSESRATCEREAGAALQAARQGQLTSENSSKYQQDATRRCAALPAGQQQDCMTLMNDPNANVQGSVSGGGVLRETTITIPGDASASGSMPSSMPMPASTSPMK